jgi:hypothetical protein
VNYSVAALSVPSARGGPAVQVATAFGRADCDASDDDLRAVEAHVRRSLAALPDVTRLVVQLTGVATWLVTSAVGRAPLGRQTPAQQARSVVTATRLRLPGVAEYLRLTRGLAAVACQQSLDPPAPDQPAAPDATAEPAAEIDA